MLLQNRIGLLALACGGVLLISEASAASLEVNVRAAYGAAEAKSPVLLEPPTGVRVATTDPVWGGTESPYGGGAILQGGLGIRANRYVSVGLGGGLRNASVSNIEFVTDHTRSAWFVGPYVRGYFPMVPVVDPWIGLGVQYMADTQKYKVPVPVSNGSSVIGDMTLEHHAVAVPISLGVDYTVAKIFSFGPSFEYALAFPAGGCAKVGGPNVGSSSFCASEAESKRITSAKGYGVWSLGLSLRLTVP